MVAAWSWFSFWLILHIMAVVVAFGPTFAFPLMGAYARRHMEAAPTVAHLTEQIERRMTIPLAVLVPLLGTALIFSGHFNLWKSKWLLISIVLYIITFFFGTLIQARNSNRLVQAIAKMPAGPPPPGATGPPPEIAALTKKLQAGGMFMTLLIVAIVVLMVWRPGCVQFGVHGC